MTSRAFRAGMVFTVVLMMISIVWAADNGVMTHAEEAIPWRYIAILLIGVAGWFLSRWVDRTTKLLDQYGHDITRIKDHLGLSD